MGIKKPSQSQFTIRGVAQQIKKNTINLEHRIQRRGAWTLLQQQLFIASIIENIKIPGIVVVEENGIKYAIDGKQRITASVAFFEGKFPMTDNIEHLEDIDIEELESEEEITLEDIRGKYYADLPQAVKNKLQKFEFKFDIYKDLSDRQTRKLFKRYNGGTTLTKSQLSHCDSDFMNDIVNDFCQQPFFTNVNISSKMKDKFTDEVVVKQVLLLTYYQGETGIGGSDIDNFVKEMESIQNLPEYEELISETMEIASYLNLAITEPVKELRKTHVPIIFMTTQEAIKKGIEPERFGLWVKEFLLNNTGRKGSNTEYQQNSTSGTGTKENTEKRIKIAIDNFKSNINNIKMPTEGNNNNSSSNNNEKSDDYDIIMKTLQTMKDTEDLQNIA